jgi:hypothetical protein
MGSNNLMVQNSGGFLVCCCYIMLSVFFANTGFGQNTTFPYNQSFRSTAMPVGIVKPAGVGGRNNTATFTNTGLVLTDATKYQFGSVVIDGFQFDATNGIEIDFEYSMYNGVPYDNLYGDGISVFLYDASAGPVISGGFGRSLGYAFLRAVNATDRQQGLTGAYLGIGIDAYGNFKYRGVGSTERLNGIGGLTWGGEGESHLTLRGAMYRGGIPGTGSGLRGINYSGYPVLVTQSTLNNASGTSLATLNTTDGTYISSTTHFSGTDAFHLRPGALSTAVGDASYRRATIILAPRTGGGFLVTVKIQHDITTTAILNNYEYLPSLTYIENANSDGITNTTTESGARGPNTTEILDAKVPASFKIGFAASTGDATQIQLIRDLVIKLPYQPVAASDVLSICGSYSAGIVNPFGNDVFYNGSLIGTPTSGNTNAFVDFSSFIFEDAARNSLGTTYTDAGKGTWSYNSATGLVTFTAIKGYFGVSSVFYSAKGTASQGGPFNQSIYRSGAAVLTANIVRCGTISNPQLPADRRVTSGQ